MYNRKNPPPLDRILLEIAGVVASLKVVHDDLTDCGVDDLKSLEAAITLLAMAHERIEVEHIGEEQIDRGLC